MFKIPTFDEGRTISITKIKKKDKLSTIINAAQSEYFDKW